MKFFKAFGKWFNKIGLLSFALALLALGTKEYVFFGLSFTLFVVAIRLRLDNV